MACCLNSGDLLGSPRKLVFLFLVLALSFSSRVQAEEERNLWIKVGTAVGFVDIVPSDKSKAPVEDTASFSFKDFENIQPVFELAGSYYPLGCYGEEDDPYIGGTCILGLGVRLHAGHYRLKGSWLDLDSTTDASTSQTEFYYRNIRFGVEMDFAFFMVLNGYSIISYGIKASLNDYDLQIVDEHKDVLVNDRGTTTVSFSWTAGLNILPLLSGILFDFDTDPIILHYTYEKTFDGYNKLDVPDINSADGGTMTIDMRQSIHTLSIFYYF